MVTTICNYCGKLIYKTSFNFKQSKNHFCNQACYAKFKELPIDYTKQVELGYLIGYILGDGWLRSKHSGLVCICTADEHMVSILKKLINLVLPMNKVLIYKRPPHEHLLKGRPIKSKGSWNIIFSSKSFFNIIRKLKYKKYKYKLPNFLNSDGKKGLIAGLAEGSVCVNKSTTLQISSKYNSNLQPVCKLLKEIEIKSTCIQYDYSAILYICGFNDLIKFKQVIPIKNERKIDKLSQSLANRKRDIYRRYPKRIKERALILFEQKLSISEIAKKLELNKRVIFEWIDNAFPDRKKIEIIGIIEVECENCGKKFHRKNSGNKRMKHHFCSITCSGMWHITKKPSMCEYCSKQIEVVPYKLLHVTHHFCSILCRNRWLAENKRRKYESVARILQ